MTEDHSTPSQGEQRGMVERVARAIDPNAFDDEWNFRNGINMDRMRLRKRKAMKAAQAAMEAMREPTEGMIAQAREDDGVDPSAPASFGGYYRNIYQSMLDSALSTVQGDKT